VEFNPDKIKTGDVLLSYSPFNLWNIIKPINPLKISDNLLGQIVSSEIRVCTQSPFSHTGLIIKNDDGKITIVEAVAKGLVENDFIEKYIKTKELIVILRLIDKDSNKIREAINDEQRAIMRETIYKVLSETNPVYDFKLLILLGLTIKLSKYRDYREALKYFKAKYDNFWICSEWVQWVYKGFEIEFCDYLETPQDIWAYSYSVCVYSNLLSNNRFVKNYPEVTKELWARTKLFNDMIVTHIAL
jgi:hypothetical protein